jgi:hypothetical protein
VADDPVCPDCRQPVSSHELYPWRGCPCIRLHWEVGPTREEKAQALVDHYLAEAVLTVRLDDALYGVTIVKDGRRLDPAEWVRADA